MRLLSLGVFKKITFTASTLAIIVLAGKLVVTPSADANSVSALEQKSLEVVTGDINVDSEFEKVQNSPKSKALKKRARSWNDVKHDRWCHDHFKGYSARTGKYFSEQGKRVTCQSPYTKSKV